MIQYSNFLIKREQSRAGSRFAECEKSRLKAKILMTLALLLTAVTGAWATDGVTSGPEEQSESFTTNQRLSTYTGQNFTITCTAAGDGDGIAIQNNKPITITSTNGLNITRVEFYMTYGHDLISTISSTPGTVVGGAGVAIAPDDYKLSAGNCSITDINATSVSFSSSHSGYVQINQITVYGTAPASSSGLEVAWNASTKTGSFQMPASDVVLTPLYAPVAKWDVVESVEQLPAALEGIIAGQDEAIVTAGQSAQGTVMYAVTTTADAAPALTAFSATVPTAKTYDDATTLYVWYYIQGHDTPDGQQPTEENTFNDSEISTTPLTVQVLTNKFDIQFTAANDNTIQAGKATVTVDDQPATLTDGKLQGVKMGSEVKMTAQPGYKFRKVEVKKGAGDTGKPLAEATVGMIVGSNGKAYAADDKDNLPSGVTAEALVCYVSDGHGLALALADEGEMNWSTAQTTCAAHTPAITGGTWKLATKDEWAYMINAAGSPDNLRYGFSSVGGTNMQSLYWSSTEYDSPRAWAYSFSSGWKKETKVKSLGYCVRACLAF